MNMASENAVQSKIERVVLYRNQALVTRRCCLDRYSGEPIRLSRIPFWMDDSSVRVNLLAPDNARLSSVSVVLKLNEEFSAPALSPIHEKLLGCERERQEELRLIQRNEDWLDCLLRLKVPPSSKDLIPDELRGRERLLSKGFRELSAYTSLRYKEALSVIREAKVRMQRLSQKRAELLDEYRRQTQLEKEKYEALSKELCLVLEELSNSPEKKESRRVEFELSYLVPFARWVPEYELQLAEGGKLASFVMLARVAQKTGETWDGVALRLSNADLLRSSKLPELKSWRIGRQQSPSRKAWRDLPADLDDLFEGYLLEKRCMPQQSEAEPGFSLELPPAEELFVSDCTVRGVKTEAVKASGMLRDTPTDGLFGSDIKQKEYKPEKRRALPMIKNGESFKETVLGAVSGGMSPGAMPMTKEEPCFDCLPPPSSAPMQRVRKKKAGFRLSREQKADLPSEVELMSDMSILEEECCEDCDGECYDDSEGQFFRDEGISDLKNAKRLNSIKSLGDEALDYGRLQLQGADSESRGSLLRRESINDFAGRMESESESSKRINGWLQSQERSVSAFQGLPLPYGTAEPGDSAGHYPVCYDKEGVAAVVDDGLWHRFVLSRSSCEIDTYYRCVPLLDNKVYRIAKLTNPLNMALLSGPVQVFDGIDFVVQSPLKATGQGEQALFHLGVEPGIRVIRNLYFEEKNSGILGGGTELIHRVDISVRSHLEHEVRLQLVERVPRSEDEDVTVRVTKIEPQAQPYDQCELEHYLDGGYAFDLKLQPDQEYKCVLEYCISLPSKRVLQGGNRRD